MQQKLEDLCQELNLLKDQSGTGSKASDHDDLQSTTLKEKFGSEKIKFVDCGCWLCDQHHHHSSSLAIPNPFSSELIWSTQVEVLKNFLEQKKKEKDSTEARTNEAEKKLSELNSSLDKLQKTNEEQKNKIGKLERAIKIAEDNNISNGTPNSTNN